MKREKLVKILCLLVVCMFAITGLLSGCGESGAAPSAQQSTTASSSTGTESKTETQTLSPATLKWYLPTSMADISADGLKAVQDELNKQLTSLNVTLELTPVDYGDYQQKMQMVIASGEPYDLCFTANWFNSYLNNANKGAFAPLDDLIQQYGPDLLKNIAQFGWDAIKVSGKIYAMPNRQNSSMTEGLYVRKDLADKYGFNPQGIIKTDDLEKFFDQIKKGDPDIYPAYVDANYKWPVMLTTYGFEEMTGRNIPGAYRLGDTSFQLVNQFETPEFKTYVEMMKRWNDKGYIRKDSATYSTSGEIPKDLQAGKFATAQTGYIAPHVSNMAKAMFDNKYDVIPAITSKSWNIGTLLQSSLTAVSINSKNKERAVMLFNQVYKDPKLYNTILYGVEGKNYNKVGDTQVELIPGTGYGSGTGQAIADWASGYQNKGWTIKGQDPDIWKKVEEWEKQAQPSALLGFAFDPTSVQTEIANVTAVVNANLRLLDTGIVDPAKTLPEFIDKLKKAGSDTIMAEAQRQLDEWRKTNGK